MANIKSQKKRIRTNEAARMRNKAVKSELKTLTKHVQSAVAEGDAEKAQAALKTVTKRLDMAAAKHVIHKNQAIEVFMRTILPERYKKWSLFHKTGSIYARNLCGVKFTT